ncbi:TrkH family potassium uptake protein [Prauserella marina]|uniref:TrkH family potassium uptake protein n=1 Tax=Prauserella marina TaxID=530584 RepID=UPI001FEA0CF7|nr:potassium transporter TrkG [Prauserella marina]
MALRSAISSARRPAVTVVLGFAVVVVIGTVLLTLPIASARGQPTDLVRALFTATSAVCITGLAVVDTAQHWSLFGEIVILALVQAGGLGIMTLASLLGLLVSRRLGLRMRLSAQRETKSAGLGDVRTVVLGVVVLSLTFEFVVATILVTRLFTGYDHSFGEALHSGVFHAVSSFNNAGFALFDDGLTAFVSDPWICLTIAFSVIAGGLGFPVFLELGRRLRGKQAWSVHTKLTVGTTLLLLVAGFAFITISEWSNEDTLGAHAPPTKLLAGFFTAVMPRSGGLHALDIDAMNSESLLVQSALMLIGGGSASTAGGIKVTTFAILAFVILAEIRGEPSVHVMGRKLAASTQRQALTIALLTVALVIGATAALLSMTDFALEAVMFESISAVATVGLSTGITPDLPPAAHVLMSVLMFIGRLGPITLASALALRDRPRRFELAEVRPIVG